MTKRLNAQQYNDEMQDLLNKTEKLKLTIVNRLYTLCSQYPDVTIARLGDINIKAKSLATKDFIKFMPFNKVIHYIEVIEKYLADQHPHKQLKLFK